MEVYLRFGLGICGRYLELPLRVLKMVANEIKQKKAAIKHTHNKGGLGVVRWLHDISSLLRKGQRRESPC